MTDKFKFSKVNRLCICSTKFPAPGIYLTSNPQVVGKCRHLLFVHPEITLFTAHGNSCSDVSVKYISCQTIQEDNLWFLQDTNLPDWISDLVNKANWTKGKINCPNCQGRLGSFDFVSGTQCQCGSNVLLPVHIVKCKVDCRKQDRISQ